MRLFGFENAQHRLALGDDLFDRASLIPSRRISATRPDSDRGAPHDRGRGYVVLSVVLNQRDLSELSAPSVAQPCVTEPT
jgi:hypothetical protein